jgi:rhodanese-related sulfurtransferase
MSIYLHFFMQHWVLSLAFIIVLFIIIVDELKSRGKGGGSVNTEGAVRLINREDAVVLDIRSSELFKKGHILNAINIAKDDLDMNIKKLKKHQTSHIIVVCDRGNEASRAALSLRKQGFTNPMVLSGGLEAWKTAKLPLSKG